MSTTEILENIKDNYEFIKKHESDNYSLKYVSITGTQIIINENTKDDFYHKFTIPERRTFGLAMLMYSDSLQKEADRIKKGLENKI
ncbi:MAG TPA: hypothetical protein VJB94_03005 [Candidatus Nanoarchaeia archaeon]|nr:hypothetical protein [Candidatus Nanoarchaeia archaeon]